MREITLIDNVIYLTGDVTFETVNNLNEQLHAMTFAQDYALDCTGVNKVDSSVSALLLATQKIARTAGVNFTIQYLPQTIIRLLKLYNLEKNFMVSTIGEIDNYSK